jgi:hypothetical protein
MLCGFVLVELSAKIAMRALLCLVPTSFYFRIPDDRSLFLSPELLRGYVALDSNEVRYDFKQRGRAKHPLVSRLLPVLSYLGKAELGGLALIFSQTFVGSEIWHGQAGEFQHAAQIGRLRIVHDLVQSPGDGGRV